MKPYNLIIQVVNYVLPDENIKIRTFKDPSPEDQDDETIMFKESAQGVQDISEELSEQKFKYPSLKLISIDGNVPDDLTDIPL